MLSFPLEGQIAQGLYWITQKLLGG